MVISFSEHEREHVTCPHEDALVITDDIDDYDVKRALIDSRISTNLLFVDALKKMERSLKDLKKVNSSDGILFTPIRCGLLPYQYT